MALITHERNLGTLMATTVAACYRHIFAMLTDMEFCREE